MSYLHHVNEVVEMLLVVNGELVVSINNPVMDDVARETDTQDVVAGVTNGLSDQKQAIFRWLQLTRRLRTRDLPMKPATVTNSKEVCKRIYFYILDGERMTDIQLVLQNCFFLAHPYSVLMMLYHEHKIRSSCCWQKHTHTVFELEINRQWHSATWHTAWGWGWEPPEARGVHEHSQSLWALPLLCCYAWLCNILSSGEKKRASVKCGKIIILSIE